jgi:(p)ppGpp synthase/HD superfamily hydrolase
MAEAPILTKRLSDAFDMAREVHNGNSIKGTDLPYLLHLLDVSSIALRHGADEDLAIAALLHDVVEDGGGAPMLDKIRDQFDDRVADIVLACSDSLEVDPARKPDWWQRKIQYVDHLRVASTDVALVSGADKLSNARSIVADHAELGETVFELFKTGRVGTLWYYRRLAQILPTRLSDAEGAQRLGASLRGVVSELLEAVGDGAADDWHVALETEEKKRASLTT